MIGRFRSIDLRFCSANFCNAGVGVGGVDGVKPRLVHGGGVVLTQTMNARGSVALIFLNGLPVRHVVSDIQNGTTSSGIFR